MALKSRDSVYFEEGTVFFAAMRINSFRKITVEKMKFSSHYWIG
jgi:hypothetical protein